ncbi:MAG: LysM peptidoglycan-binding domain-containing protein [Bacteroides sp.]|nr:LysM peptidoglycan-binding domain-containing protein [Ruminococcus flavefaciens]MCM1555251.1 LysM peptidoglycan-binding domain-containing protein [Bacteroides sp.]
MKIKSFLFRICFFALLLCIGAKLGAQESATPFQASPVVPAKVSDTILGKAYRVHTVQKGHTLYSICRAYQVPADSILKDSPANQVDIDEFIYIPLRLLPGERAQEFSRFSGKRPWAVVFLQKDEVAQTVTSDRQETAPVETGSEVSESAEPENLRPGGAVQERTELEEDSVEVEKGRGKKRRERREERMAEADTAVVTDSLDVFLSDSVFVTPHPQAKEYKDSLRVSLLLPLYSNTPQDKKAYIYLPFFEGATVAWQEHLDPAFFNPPVSDTVGADSLAMAVPEIPADTTPKPHISLRVYDLTQSADALDSIVNDAYFQASDAVVATAFVDQFVRLDSLSKAWQMPVIHPISERDSMGFANSYFVQLAASYGTQIRHIAGFIKEHHAKSRVLVITDSAESEVRKAGQLQALLPECEHLYFNAATVERLESFSEDNTKVVIVPFYRKEITAVKTVLPLRQAKGNITIIAPNVWLDYASVDLDYYIQNNLTVYHTFCSTVQNTDLLEFSRKYYFLYRALPNPLAYQGYKTLLWLLDNLNARNADFMRYLDAGNEDEETHREGEDEEIYILKEREMGGFENRDVHFVKISDNKLEHFK